MKTLRLPLTKGYFAIVDYDEFLWLNQWDWHYLTSGSGGRAARKDRYGKYIYLHVSLMKRWELYIEGLEVDHKDRDGLNNIRENLRMATHQENMRNKNVLPNNSSGVTGVSYHKNRYRAYITVNDKQIHCGRHKTIEEAIRARKEAELKYFGDFAPIFGEQI